MALAIPASATPERAAPSQEAALFARIAQWSALGFALALFGLGAFAPQALNDGDTFWHIEAGRWVLAHRGAPHADPFSYTYAGAPWTAHEWLAEVLMALAYGAAGLKGLMALTGAAVGTAFFALAREVRRDLRGPAIVATLAIAALIVAPSLLARPHILALPPMALWIVALARTRAKGAPPSLATLPLMTLWANLHGGFIFGLALLGPFALDAILGAPPERRLGLSVRWASFAALSLAAALLTPYGLDGLVFPIKLASNSNMAVVIEWQPEKLMAFGPFEWALLGLFAVGLLRGLKLRLAPALLLVGLTLMTLQHSRHALLFAMLAPLLVARPLGAAFGEETPAPEPAMARRNDLLFAAGALALFALRLIVPLPLHDTKPTPVSALAAVPAELRDKPVFNSLADGGYLILQGVKPFIDGRFDMYPKAHVDDYLQVIGGDRDAARRVLDGRDVAWTILQPNDRLVDLLDHDPGWKRLYADAFAIVHVRAELGLRGSQ